MKFYTDIIKKSWEITWHHKVLWVLGIFVAIWGGKGIEVELNSARAIGSADSPLNPAFWDMQKWLTALQNMGISVDTLPLITLGIVISILLLITCAVIILSQIGVIDAFAQFGKKNTVSERYALQHAWTAGKKHFWVVLSMNILKNAVQYGLLAIAVAPLFIERFDMHVGVWWILIGLLLCIPLNIISTLLMRLAINDSILQHSSFAVALRNAVILGSKNIGVVLELAVIMFCVYLGIIMIVTPIISAVLTLPSFLLVLSNAPDVFGLSWLYLHDQLYVIVFVVILYLCSVLFSVWHMGTWTLLYQDLQLGNRKSKIHRFLNKTTQKR